MTFRALCPAYIRPLFCEGKGPFRWAALSGEASDIARTDQLVLEMFPHDEHLSRWIKLAQKRVRFQGLPSRICWLGYGERDKFGLALNDLVAERRAESAHRDWARPSGLRIGGFSLIAKRKPCWTALTQLQTGRC